MNDEQLDKVHAIALELSGEIEWCELVTGAPLHIPKARVEIDASALASIRRLIDAMFDEAMRGTLRRMAGHQEAELEAAGIVQAAVKYHTPAGNLYLKTKFRRFQVPFIQAAADEFVPSAALQLRGHRPYKPSSMN